MHSPEGEVETKRTTQKCKRDDKDPDTGQMHASKEQIPKQNPKMNVTWDKTTTSLVADGQRRSERLNPNLVPEQKLISLMAKIAKWDN